jgi:hypothetical protein
LRALSAKGQNDKTQAQVKTVKDRGLCSFQSNQSGCGAYALIEKQACYNQAQLNENMQDSAGFVESEPVLLVGV